MANYALKLVCLTIGSCVGLLPILSSAETLVPRTMQYEFEVKEDGVGKTCNLVLILMNIPSPETVNFHFIVAQQKSTAVTFVGFTLDVGDLSFSNGLPAGEEKAVLSSGAFISSTFSSVGRLNGGPINDGGIFETTADAQVYAPYLMAFLSGGFQIQFERRGVPGSRVYEVDQKPPLDVVAQFQTCVSSLKQ